MQIALLGPLEIRADDGSVVDVAGARLHTLLTRLALDAGRAVPVRILVDAVWGDRPPAEETNALQTLVSRLRRLLGGASIVGAAGGYRLAVAAEDVDALRFERLAADGARLLRAGDHSAAADHLRRGLVLWRGAALADASGAGDALAVYASRLDDLRLGAVVDRIETDLALGEPAAVVSELETLAADHPLHERIVAQLVRALAESGRPADALAAYERIRTRLADELGVDPSAELRELHLRLLRGEVDQPRPSSVRRTNLKSQLTSFVGRDDEVSRIGKSLERHRLVTLVGPGGAGKTRLASEAASRVIDTAIDGVWFVELAPVTSGADVPRAVLESVGLREASSLDRRTMSARDAVTRLLDGLVDKQVLVVVDNCEHVIEATAGLVDQLLSQCADLRVLATSREPLGIVGEVLLAVPPLGQPSPSATAQDALEYPAVRLFADRAAAARPDFVVDDATVATVVDIVRRLDGLPLAIELAAARLRSLALEDIADRISDRFRLLTGGSRTALPRHRTLRAVVEWSWDLLTPEERVLTEQLSVFPSGVTVDSAIAISDAAPEDVPDLLASLVDKSLLQSVGTGRRMRMLETIREYGAERLAERGELGAVRARHAEHFAALMADAEPHLLQSDQLSWFEVLRVERENIVAALRYLCDVGDSERGLQLAVSLGGYAMMLGLTDEMLIWLGEALAVPVDRDSEIRLVARALHLMSIAATGQSADAVGDGMRELAELAGQLGDITALGLPWMHVVRIASAFFSEDRELTARYLDAALGSADAWSRGSGLMFRAMLAENDGDVDGMRADSQAARELFERLGERWGLASTMRGVAQVATLDGDLDLAAECYGRAISLAGELHSRDDEGYLYGRLADLELRRGNVDAARSLVGCARAAAEQGGGAMEVAYSLAMLGAVEHVAGNPVQARELQQEALAKVESMPREHPVQGHIRSLVLSVAVRVASGSGNLDEARTLAREALEVGCGTKDMPVIAGVGVTLAELAVLSGDPSAGAVILGASDVLRGAPDPTALDVVSASRLLREQLGDDGFVAGVAQGAALDRDAALAALRVV